MNRDLRLTLSENHVISTPRQVSKRSLDSFREEWEWNGYGLKIDIAKMIPEDSMYSKDTIMYALYVLNHILQLNLKSIFKWEFVINLFSKLSYELQDSIVSGDYTQQEIQKKIINEASLLLTNMYWPTEQCDEETKSEWKLKMKEAIKVCKHPRKYGIET